MHCKAGVYKQTMSKNTTNSVATEKADISHHKSEIVWVCAITLLDYVILCFIHSMFVSIHIFKSLRSSNNNKNENKSKRGALCRTTEISTASGSTSAGLCHWGARPGSASSAGSAPRSHNAPWEKRCDASNVFQGVSETFLQVSQCHTCYLYLTCPWHIKYVFTIFSMFNSFQDTISISIILLSLPFIIRSKILNISCHKMPERQSFHKIQRASSTYHTFPDRIWS